VDGAYGFVDGGVCSLSGFTFHHSYGTTTEGYDVFACTEVDGGCDVKVWVTGRAYSKHTGAHNHPSDPVSVRKRFIYERSKDGLAVAPLTSSIRQVRQEALQGEDDEVVMAVDSENHRRMAAREKKVGLGTSTARFGRHRSWHGIQRLSGLPTGRTDPLHLKIPLEQKMFPDGEKFILYDKGRCRDRFVPAVVFFLSDATRGTFELLLRAIKIWINKYLRTVWKPARIRTDFESAMIAAVPTILSEFLRQLQFATCSVRSGLHSSLSPFRLDCPLVLQGPLRPRGAS
jgi:hypothetical protein